MKCRRAMMSRGTGRCNGAFPSGPRVHAQLHACNIGVAWRSPDAGFRETQASFLRRYERSSSGCDQRLSALHPKSSFRSTQMPIHLKSQVNEVFGHRRRVKPSKSSSRILQTKGEGSRGGQGSARGILESGGGPSLERTKVLLVASP
jgi:hypothetical protein